MRGKYAFLSFSDFQTLDPWFPPKYVTVSNTWATEDTVTSYLTKYTLCNGDVGGGDDDHVGNDDVDDVIADHIDG